ncbi:hypothetical protein Tco_0926392 [Tanacetum coccineum]|uniref:Uncharacterized protein n=1 Tax=Tanacetum coccineum TaxID=301880 RepID=A0ABQ5DBN0_9ASTR
MGVQYNFILFVSECQRAYGVIFITVSTVVCSRTAGESSVAGTAGVVTIVGVYGHLRMHFRKASPFGLVSMYRKNRDRHCAYHRVASIVHISRFNPFVIVKLTTFAVMCKAYGDEPTMDLLRSFLNLSPAGSFFFIKNKIISSDYPELLLEENKLDKKSFKDKIPLQSQPARLRNLFFGLWLVLEIDFRSFMIQGVDGEFNFLPGRGLDEGQDSPFMKSMNNRSLVVDADPISVVHPSAFAKNIIYSDNASHENDDLTPVDLSKPYDLKIGNTSKAAGKRKRDVGSHREDSRQRTQKVPPQASKVVGDASTPLDVDKFPFAKELRDATDCHWVVAHVTPPSWKQHLKEISLEQLYDIHDSAYMCQAILDNMLNSRTRELISSLHKAKASCDAIRKREVKKDKAYAELEKNWRVNGLHNEYSRLMLEEKKLANYEQTLSTLRARDRAAVVTKVVPDAAMKLIQSDEVGILVAKLAKASKFHDKCAAFKEVSNLKEPFMLEKMLGYRPSSKEEFDRAGDDLANASYPFLVELTIDPYALMEQLLSNKPQSLHSNPALSHSKPLSLKAP